jgi:hypothetical protein
MKYFATAPSPFIDLPDLGAAFRLREALSQIGSQCADGEEAVEMFEEEQELLVGGRQQVHELSKHARRAQMHARSLVFAVDSFVKMVEAMAADQAAPAAALTTALDGFTAAVPGAKDLRDSLHHIEDRARGLDRRGRTIVPAGAAPAGFAATAGSPPMYVGTNISDNRVFCTAGDGQTVELEVSEATVSLMAQCLQQVVDALAWKSSGTPWRIPS